MIFQRNATDQLNQWKAQIKRKPLIIRGARQVGKTTLVKEFGKNYKHFIYLNLELADDARFFDKENAVRHITESIFLREQIPTKDRSDSLLFIDEIQESPAAIAILRYFYEEIPTLHVIAAGSLLEHAMGSVPSFPVGRVQYLHLHPLSFSEFLLAKGNIEAIKQLERIPLQAFAHSVLKNLFNEYTIVGGMPEIVANYISHESLSNLPQVYESIWDTYKRDIKKYASNKSEAEIMRHIVGTAHLYIDQRIRFQNFGNSNYRSREVGEAFRSLDRARLLQLIYPTTETEIPIRPDLKKKPKLQYLDTGILNYELRIQANMLGVDDLSPTFKGAIIPHIIFQELIAQQILGYHKPCFWVREKSQSTAEVDLVIQHENLIIPVEIKSGKAGRLRSLHQFIDRTNHTTAVRFYAGQLSIEKHETPGEQKPYTLINLPYFLASQLKNYLHHF